MPLRFVVSQRDHAPADRYDHEALDIHTQREKEVRRHREHRIRLSRRTYIEHGLCTTAAPASYLGGWLAEWIWLWLWLAA